MIRIASAEVMALSLPLRTPVRMSVGTVASAESLVVRLSESEGRDGWGEAASAPAMTGEFIEGMAAAGRYLAGRCKGAEFTEAVQVPAILNAALSRNHGAKAAFEIAMLDLLGQAKGLQLCDLIGGRQRGSVPVLKMIGGATLDEEISEARSAADAGFIMFKVKVGLGTPEADLARCTAIRRALGPDVQISADANGAFDLPAALTFARRAQDAGLDFIEQPVAAGNLPDMAAVADACEVPIGADEGIHELVDIRAHFEAKAAAGGSLKLIKLGGMLAAMQAGRLMHDLGMSVNLAGKVAETSIAAAALSHVAVAVPRLDWGTSVTHQYLAGDVTETPVHLADGCLRTPDGVGLGVRPDREKLEQCKLAI